MHTHIYVHAGDDRTWNEEFKDPTDEHFRFARCDNGFRRAVTENYTREGFQTMMQDNGVRLVDLNQWHIASDYQKVVDDIRQVCMYVGYVVGWTDAMNVC